MAKTKRPPKASEEGVPPVEIVVRRGALRRFDRLKRDAADVPVVVKWDRRQAERRTAGGEEQPDRRQHDRRQKPPFTWEMADFVVVNPPTDED